MRGLKMTISGVGFLIASMIQLSSIQSYLFNWSMGKIREEGILSVLALVGPYPTFLFMLSIIFIILGVPLTIIGLFTNDK